MMRIPVVIAILLWLSSCSNESPISSKLSDAAAYQEALKTFWSQPESSPLHEEEWAGFSGITFYPLDEQYRVVATFTPADSGLSVLAMPTSARKVKYFKPYGTLSFTIRDTVLSLTVYQADPPHEEDPDGLFLPFTDQTSGKTSYGAGRYLDLSIKDIQEGTIRLDFNKAYNPYCAYSAHYNCPIPPAGNKLPVAIQAGVSYIQGLH